MDAIGSDDEVRTLDFAAGKVHFDMVSSLRKCNAAPAENDRVLL